jgi:DNA repair exonuclease SbcCD ATPase subunit
MDTLDAFGRLVVAFEGSEGSPEDIRAAWAAFLHLRSSLEAKLAETTALEEQLLEERRQVKEAKAEADAALRSAVGTAASGVRQSIIDTQALVTDRVVDAIRGNKELNSFADSAQHILRTADLMSRDGRYMVEHLKQTVIGLCDGHERLLELTHENSTLGTQVADRDGRIEHLERRLAHATEECQQRRDDLSREQEHARAAQAASKMKSETAEARAALLEASVSELQRSVGATQVDNANKRRLARKLIQRVAARDEIIGQLQDQLRDATAELGESRSDTIALSDKVDSLQDLLMQKDIEMAEMAQRFHDRLADAYSCDAVSGEATAAAEARADRLLAQMQDCKRREEDLSQEVTRLGERLEQTGNLAIQREAQLQQELTSLADALRERDDAKVYADEQTANITAELQATNKNLVTVTQDQKIMQSQLAEKTSALTRTEAMLRDQEVLQSRLRHANAQLSESERWRVELSVSIAKLEETQAVQLAAVEKRLHDAEAKLQGHGEPEKKLRDVEAAANAAQSQLAGAEGKLRDVEAIANTTESQLADAEGKLRDAESDLALLKPSSWS